MEMVKIKRFIPGQYDTPLVELPLESLINGEYILVEGGRDKEVVELDKEAVNNDPVAKEELLAEIDSNNLCVIYREDWEQSINEKNNLIIDKLIDFLSYRVEVNTYSYKFNYILFLKIESLNMVGKVLHIAYYNYQEERIDFSSIPVDKIECIVYNKLYYGVIEGFNKLDMFQFIEDHSKDIVQRYKERKDDII